MSNGLDRPTVAAGIRESFDTVVLPHLDAAYRLARWLMRDADVAEGAVQEAWRQGSLRPGRALLHRLKAVSR